MRYKRILILLCLCFLIVLGVDYLTLGNKYRVVFRDKNIFVNEIKKKSFVVDNRSIGHGPFGDEIKLDIKIYEFKNKVQVERKRDVLKLEYMKDKDKVNKHYFSKDNIIVLYRGNNRTALYYLENYLGKQIMGEDYKSLNQEQLIEIYTKSLDSLMNGDLVGGNFFYAINMETCEFANLSFYNKQKILNHFYKYRRPVLNASIDTLKKFKLIGKHGHVILGGLVLSIDRVIFESDEKIIVHVHKYSSGLAADGVRCEFLYKNGQWKLVNSSRTWIS